MMITGALRIRCLDFSRRICTISASCPSICRFCCQVSPMLSASCSFGSCLVITTKRQGCLPCGDGAQRAASNTCSINSCETGRVWNFRTLRLLCNKVAKVSVRIGNVTGLCSDCVVTLIYNLCIVALLTEHVTGTYRSQGHVIGFLRFPRLEYRCNH